MISADPAARARTLVRWAGPLTGLWIVASTVAMLYRNQSDPNRSWWAEDGTIFYSDALRSSFWRTLVTPYNGYLQLAARPVAEIATWFPLRDGPMVMTILTDVCISLVSIYVYRASRDYLTTGWGPLLLGLLVVALPQTGPETTGLVADLHWYLDFAALWALLRPPTTWTRWASSATVIAVALLSDPLAALMLIPFTVDTWSRRREPQPQRLFGRRLALGAVAVVAGLVQFGVSLSTRGYWGRTGLRDIARFGLVRVCEALLVGERWMAAVYNHTGFVPAVLAGVVEAVVLVWAITKVDRPRAALCVSLLVAGTLLVIVCLTTRGGELTLSGSRFSIDGSRYTVIPAFMCWSAAILLVERLAQGMPPPRRRQVLRTTAAVVGVVLIANWPFQFARNRGITWSAQLAAARSLCALPPGQRPPQPPALVRDEGPAEPPADSGLVRVLSEPESGAYHPFTIQIPCSRMR